MGQTVSVYPCGNYEKRTVRRALEEVLAPLGGLDFVKPGMTVAVKVNLLAGSSPEKAVTTHPALVAELTGMLTERGARVIVGDSPGGPFTQKMLRRVYQTCGLEAVEKAGGELNEDTSVAAAAFPEAVSVKTFHYTAWLDQADCIINFCKLKTHGMMQMTCAVKNFFGTIPGTVKPEYHMRFPDYEDFANLMVDLQEYFKPVLHIVDAVDCMEGNGPASGTPRHMGLLLASRRPYVLDMVCAHLIGFEPMEIPTVQAAAKRNLCPARYEEAAAFLTGTDPEPYVIPDFRRTDTQRKITFVNFGPAQRFMTQFMRKTFSTKPAVKRRQCIGCGKCGGICPAKAITMKKKKPVIDRKKCIRCFCCQEFCPVGAMKSKRR